MRILSLYCCIRTARISWLRHILEGYDGLALLSTLSAEQGLVRLQAPACSYVDLVLLMESLAPELTPFPVLAPISTVDAQ
jgi:hypothetical protein